MKPTKKYYIFGYDPGGKDGHGVAMLKVRKNGIAWEAEGLELNQLQTVDEVIAWLKRILGKKGKIVASGIDTLTAWSQAKGGWRPADKWLRKSYKLVENSVITPNGIQGSMCLNGAMILRWLQSRRDRGGKITEAHPKVCFFALRNQEERHPWAKAQTERNGVTPRPCANKEEASRDLLVWLGLAPDSITIPSEHDHCFDAVLGCLAALKGLNREWPLDLHDGADVIHPFGLTHYWWPEAV